MLASLPGYVLATWGRRAKVATIIIKIVCFDKPLWLRPLTAPTAKAVASAVPRHYSTPQLHARFRIAHSTKLDVNKKKV